jgi:hypothetical protein
VPRFSHLGHECLQRSTTPAQLQHNFSTTPAQLQNNSSTTPAQLQHNSRTTPAQLQHSSSTTSAQLQHNTSTTPEQLTTPSHDHANGFSICLTLAPQPLTPRCVRTALFNEVVRCVISQQNYAPESRTALFNEAVSPHHPPQLRSDVIYHINDSTPGMILPSVLVYTNPKSMSGNVHIARLVRNCRRIDYLATT